MVGNKSEDTVSFVDLDTGNELARVPTGKAPHEVAISPDGKQAAVVAYGGKTIDIFDIATASLSRRLDISPGEAPHGVAWLQDGRIVATAEKSSGIVIVKPRTGSVQLVSTDAKGTHMLVVSPDQRRAYAANMMSGTISIIDLRRARKISDINVGGYPEGIAITPDGKELWVGDNSGGRVRVVDLATRAVVATIESDPVPIRVAISPNGEIAVTSHIGSGVLNVFDVASRTRLRTIEISGNREAVQVTAIFSADGRRVFVAETGHNTVAEVDIEKGQVLRRLSAGKGGDGLGVAP
ncbi:MAG: beta-propeller fold lactonase family protein [Novosphingobium sp.]|nr:beta-propeller fold lactonase family protein [Novosphingobium sp.]